MQPPGLHHGNGNEPIVAVGVDRQSRWKELLQRFRREGVGENQRVREERTDRDRVAAKAIEHQCTVSTVSRPQSIERSRAAHSVDSPGGGSMKLRSTTTAP